MDFIFLPPHVSIPQSLIFTHSVLFACPQLPNKPTPIFKFTVMEDGSLENAVHRVRQCWYPQMKQHLQVWPFFNALNFYFVPLHNRVVVRNVAFVLWSALMSKHSHSIEQAETGTKSSKVETADQVK